MDDESITVSSLPLSLSRGRLFYGDRPNQATLDQLRTLDLACIWNLEPRDEELIRQEVAVAQVISAQIADFEAPGPTFGAQLDAVCELLRTGRSVFVHCHAGIGRTGTALAAIMVRLEGVSPDAALLRAREAVGGPETDEQRKYVRSLRGIAE